MKYNLGILKNGRDGRMLVKDIEILKNFEVLFGKKILLYGAGTYGRKAKRLLDNIKGTQLYAYIESDSREWKRKNGNSECEGIPVISINELKDKLLDEEYILIITMNVSMIEKVISIIEERIPEIYKVYTWFGLHYSFELNINDERISHNYREEFLLIKEYKRSRNRFYFSNDAYQMLNENSVMVFQPGKVGSSSVFVSLQKYGVACSHIHCINHTTAHYDALKDEYYDKLISLWKNKYREKKCIKIISLVRDPIARNVSLYFQQFCDDFIEYDIPQVDTYEGLIDYIRYDAKAGNNGYMFDWFNKEIKELFDIDVYSYPFDKDKGYTIIKKGNVELLLMTMEKMNYNVQVVGDFVGIPNFEYTLCNVGAEKEYKYAYKEVLEKIDICDDIIEFYYASNGSMDHFYTEEQKNKFKKKWKRKLI